MLLADYFLEKTGKKITRISTTATDILMNYHRLAVIIPVFLYRKWVCFHWNLNDNSFKAGKMSAVKGINRFHPLV